MTHGSRTYVNCALTPYAFDGVPSSLPAVVFPPKTPTRRRSPDLSAYDRLDPPRPVRPRRSGYRHSNGSDGADALAYALAGLEAKVRAGL